MPIHTTMSLTANAWTCINAGSPAAGDFSIISQSGLLYVKPMGTSVTAPTDTLGALTLIAPEQSIVGQTIAKIWPGAGALTYIWVMSPHSVKAMVSCA